MLRSLVGSEMCIRDRFHTPWCGHCKAIAPAWHALTREFKGPGPILVAEVDCSTQEPLCQKLGVQAYPTILYGQLHNLQEYGGGRGLEELREFCHAHLGSSCGPSRPDLCGERERKAIEHAMALPVQELVRRVDRAERELEQVELRYAQDLEKLREQHQRLTAQRERRTWQIKSKSGLGILRTVQAHRAVLPVQRIVVAHGYTAYPEKHWFPWLKSTMEQHGIEVVIPQLPNADKPVKSEWVAALAEALGPPDERTLLIGHSLGCVTALHLLGGMAGDWRLAGLVLVAGFHEPLENLPELDEFTAGFNVDPGTLVERIRFRLAVYSDNDARVAQDKSIRMAEWLGAEQELVPGVGHFCQANGLTEFPQLLAMLQKAGLLLGWS
eukprot:TRINITY_DN5178_c0_g2_i1.p1 TRINITY_DN5178_c0_g2~~TRINITY_DN5178_c0_g2_i1.p1  ORF type:complete len:383 (-),score=88.89 TRINITY_DN5178_c0_g2_i1:171-1319(-)